jgi:cell filamentation protein
MSVMAGQRDRYAPTGAEAEFEPGSQGRVLRNHLGIRSSRAMAACESRALIVAIERLAKEVPEDQRFSAEDIRMMHRTWLGEIYPWAGEYRQVNVSKPGVHFAAAREIPRLMQDLGRGPLMKLTPCRATTLDEQARALGVVHAELVLVHPFREGNGRCARILATLMGLQAGLPMLDFAALDGKGRNRYFAAIQEALGRDYGPITSLFRDVIAGTLQGRLASDA